MFLSTRNNSEIDSYKDLLKIVGSLSNLFAETNIPYINSRISENLFCRIFSAKNLSRSDVSADASIEKIGIGIKTFIEGNGKTMQKVAEFNKDKKIYSQGSPLKIIQTISELRNERLEATKRIHSLDNLLYHCITRKKGLILAYDSTMDSVNIQNISQVVEKGNIILFSDDLNEYSFNLTKSTLYKRFLTPSSMLEIPVNIIENPFEILQNLLKNFNHELKFAPIDELLHIFLPLYSDKQGTVPEKSQLNQWNANGRLRDPNEIYIHIPAWIHRKFLNFFPPRDTTFDLLLPNGETMNAKVCQDNSKALMSNPNKALGKWLLRDILNLNEGELLTYEKLQTIGLDSVVIYKENEGKFTINFTKIGSYENFKKNLDISDSSE